MHAMSTPTQTRPDAIAYAARSTAAPLDRATLSWVALMLGGAFSFMFLGGCFCLGMLRVLRMADSMQISPWATQAQITAQLAIVAGRVPVLFYTLLAMAAACFLTSVALIVALLRKLR